MFTVMVHILTWWFCVSIGLGILYIGLRKLSNKFFTQINGGHQ